MKRLTSELDKKLDFVEHWKSSGEENILIQFCNWTTLYKDNYDYTRIHYQKPKEYNTCDIKAMIVTKKTLQLGQYLLVYNLKKKHIIEYWIKLQIFKST